MKFTYRYQTKWHDTDANREVRPTEVLAYMQETSNHHLRSSGMELDELRDKHGLAFLLSRIALRMYRPLRYGEEIDVQTWVCASRGMSFQRCYRILCGDDVVAEAFSVWALMDLTQGKLVPVSAFPYDIEPDEPLGTEFLSRLRLPPVAEMEAVGERCIVYSDIDYNGHMNNTRYPDMLCDFTPDMRARRAVGMNLSFLREAAYGHSLAVFRAPHPTDPNAFYFRTLDDNAVCLEALLYTEVIG